MQGLSKEVKHALSTLQLDVGFLLAIGRVCSL